MLDLESFIDEVSTTAEQLALLQLCWLCAVSWLDDSFSLLKLPEIHQVDDSCIGCGFLESVCSLTYLMLLNLVNLIGGCM